MHDWLRDNREGKWVLILNNVDNTSFLVKDQSTSQEGHTNSRGSKKVRLLIEYLPRYPNRSILITTRSKNIALELVKQHDIIEIELLSKADTLELFTKKLGRNVSGDNATELATALEFMPLAIV